MTTYNPALIRLVTGRYRDLQGLSTVADAAILLLFAAGMYLARLIWGDSKSLWGMAFFLAVCGTYLWARFTLIRRRIDEYYTGRCGRVQWSQARPFAFPLYMQGIVLARQLIELHVPTPVRVTLVLAVLAGMPARIVLRDWPHRVHWLLPVAVGVVVAATYAGVTTREQAMAWVLPALFACGAALAAAGALDHALLLKILRAVPSDQPEPAQVQAP